MHASMSCVLSNEGRKARNPVSAGVLRCYMQGSSRDCTALSCCLRAMTAETAVPKRTSFQLSPRIYPLHLSLQSSTNARRCTPARTPSCVHLQHRRARTSPVLPPFIRRSPATHPALEAVAGARRAQEVLEVQGAVGHEVIVADGGVVEDGQLDLMAVGHRGGELLVVRGLVGLLLGAGLPDAHLIHADRHVGVQQLVALTEQRVAEGPAGGLQPHSLADPHLQVPVELHGSGHGHPPGAPRSPEDNQSRVSSRPALSRLACSGGRAAAEQLPPGHAASPQPPPRAPPTSRGCGWPLRPARGSARLCSARTPGVWDGGGRGGARSPRREGGPGLGG